MTICSHIYIVNICSLVLLVLIGCAPQHPKPLQSAAQLRKSDTKNLWILEKDQNQDGQVDLEISYADAEMTQMKSKKRDLNYNGAWDITDMYVDGQLTERHMDFDFDRNIDQIDYFKNGQLEKSEIFLNFEKKARLWKYFFEGKLQRSEADRSRDGKIDTWTYYDPQGRIVRIGRDSNADGTIDSWRRYDAESIPSSAEWGLVGAALLRPLTPAHLSSISFRFKWNMVCY